MLTDSASQYEMEGVNDIPKSFQKLINEIQNVKKNKKQPIKNPSLASLDIKTVQRNPKNSAIIKKKRKSKKPRPLDIDLEENDDKSNLPKDSGVRVLNQTNITDFLNTVKQNLLNCYADKNSKGTEKYDEVPNENDEIHSDDQLFYPHQNPATDFKKSDFSVSAFQNPDYLSYLSSRNGNDFNAVSEKCGDRNITNNGNKTNRIQNAEGSGWKTFNEISTDIDFPIERKKNIAPSTFYSCNKANIKTLSKAAEKINQSGIDPLLTKTQNNDVSKINHKNKSKDVTKNWLAMLKDDQEKISNLLIQVKFMNDAITKSTQDISKFFMNRNN